MIIVSQDTEGLAKAAKELFIQSLSNERVEQMLREVPLGDDAQLAKIYPKHEMSPGYYDYVLYLMWLKQNISAGVEFEDLTAAEADGLVAITRARYEFEKEYPACSDCGVRNDRGSAHLCPVRMRKNAGRR
ncbi:MAG TPA: hypothetical protein VFB79_07240 [Candidatus Angelobacter sp.]|nr:hypothetical protein [Candidatus Angelobacter sp.]